MKKIIALFALLLCITIPFGASALSGVSPWAEAEYKKAVDNNLLPDILKDKDLTEAINRTEFAAVSVKLYEALAGKEIAAPAENPFTDTDNVDVLKAYAAGITNGIGEGLFGGDALLTREQAATMLTRTYEKSMNVTAKAGKVEVFADDAVISGYAKDSVYFMSEKGIVKGVGEGKFDPQAQSAREVAVVISVRTLEAFAKKGPENLRKYFPAFTTNGTEIREEINEGSTKIYYEGVTEEEYVSYIKMVKMSFPDVTYELDEAGQKGVQCSNERFTFKAGWTGKGATYLTIEKR